MTRSRPAAAAPGTPSTAAAPATASGTTSDTASSAPPHSDALVAMRGRLGPDDFQPELMERADADAIDRVGPADDVDDGARERRVPAFISMITRASGNRPEHLFEPRHANSLAAKWVSALALQTESGIHACQLIRRAHAHRTCGVGRALESGVVNHDRHAVARQVHVAFDAVAAQCQAALEGGHGVFRGQLGAAAMGKDEPRAGGKGMSGTRHRRQAS